MIRKKVELPIMKSFNLIILIMFPITITSMVLADVDAKEGRAIAECLESFGGATLENIRRLQRYKHWSENYEEIPCFTHCYLSKMFDFYNKTNGFNGPKVVEKFGNTIYNACETKLAEGNSHCEVAYNGFHCMVNLEDDPFVVIEDMKGVSLDAKVAMQDCLHKFDQFAWEKFAEYRDYPLIEPIPCYIRCFVEKLKLFNHRLRKWNISTMRQKFSFPREDASIAFCQVLGQRRSRHSCPWMYREFMCYAMSHKV